MSLKHGLLGLLDYGAMTGYELCKTFDDSLAFFWQATTSQVYRELAAMEGKGWLSSQEVIQSGKPNKKLYRITDAGRSALDEWLLEPGGPRDMETRSSFLMRMFFSHRAGTAESISRLSRFREAALAALASLEESDAIDKYRGQVIEGPSLYWSLTADFGKAYYRMCAYWAESSIAKIMEAAK